MLGGGFKVSLVLSLHPRRKDVCYQSFQATQKYEIRGRKSSIDFSVALESPLTFRPLFPWWLQAHTHKAYFSHQRESLAGLGGYARHAAQVMVGSEALCPWFLGCLQYLKYLCFGCGGE